MPYLSVPFRITSSDLEWLSDTKHCAVCLRQLTFLSTNNHACCDRLNLTRVSISVLFLGIIWRLLVCDVDVCGAVFGCAYPLTPPDTHIVSESHDTIKIRCNTSEQSWTLKCAASGRQWTGTTGNCTASKCSSKLRPLRLTLLSVGCWETPPQNDVHEICVAQESKKPLGLDFYFLHFAIHALRPENIDCGAVVGEH